ncbi:MAG: thymidine phosphorylase [Balneolaceae bacterium]|nr:MAG: thymidine phosphorylase [Balneolaceae bacterium]
MNIVSLIRKKRDNEELSPDEIKTLISAYAKDQVPDYQMSAMLMAMFINGLNDEESAAFTSAMLYSGEVLDLGSIPGLKVDKHSTGGVGDKISLLLAPVVAACGVPVPMISGRGLGHTGGTLDKLESITGFNVNLDLDRYREVLAKHNLVLIGQTEEIAPADKRLYALRDVTATVESIPLIAGSIMSKKLAEGIDALVLDVKYGSGAFMREKSDAIALAQKLVKIGESFGKRTLAFLTNMEQPLGYKIGNWLEVEESIDGLRGKGPDDIMELTYVLSGAMIYLGGKAASISEGIKLAEQAVSNGDALRKFRDIVEEQGGDTSLIDHPEKYKKPEIVHEVKARDDGYVFSIDAYSVGMAALELGAGRRSKEDRIDPVSGIVLEKKLGDQVKKGETLAFLHTNNTTYLNTAETLFQKAVVIAKDIPKIEPLLNCRIDKDGIHESITQ